LPGAARPFVSMPPQVRALRPPDTRRRNASHTTRHHPKAHRDPFFAAAAAPEKSQPPSRLLAPRDSAYPAKQKNRSRKTARSGKDSVRYPG
jgi:hypothetical protein